MNLRHYYSRTPRRKKLLVATVSRRSARELPSVVRGLLLLTVRVVFGKARALTALALAPLALLGVRLQEGDVIGVQHVNDVLGQGSSESLRCVTIHT